MWQSSNFLGGAYDFETLTVGTTAVGCTAAKYTKTATNPGARAVIITTGAVAVRMRLDGSAPTATVGHYIPASTTFIIEGAKNISNLKLIRDTTAGADASTSVTYLR